MDHTTSFKFDNLNHDNYSSWAFKMKMILSREGVWDEVSTGLAHGEVATEVRK